MPEQRKAIVHGPFIIVLKIIVSANAKHTNMVKIPGTAGSSICVVALSSKVQFVVMRKIMVRARAKPTDMVRITATAGSSILVVACRLRFKRRSLMNLIQRSMVLRT